MKSINTPETLAHPFWPVKSSESFPMWDSSYPMIHHKVSLSQRGKMIVSYSRYVGKPYGVSSSRRVLSPGLFLRKFDYIRQCLDYALGLTKAQRQVTLRLLRLWAYYGYVYPKEAQVTEEPGCSKATFWRTIRVLENMGLLSRVNRYIIRPEAQISNLYRLDKLILLIARYLAEHIAHVWPDWLTPILTMPARQFYHWVFQSPEARAGPGALALADL